MDIFNFGIKILLLFTFIFFLIFFFFCRYWAEDWHPERKSIIGFMVSIFYSFWLFVVGFFFVALLSILVQSFL